MFRTPLSGPNENPFPAYTCFRRGSAFRRTCQGATPDRVFTITAPEVRSPYTAEGIPRITSTDSILSVAICRASRPEPAVDSPAVPMVDVFRTCRLASLDRVTPSMMTAVPNAFALLDPISLIVNWFTRFKPGFSVRFPGISCIISLRLDGCTWSRACFSIREEEFRPPPSFAVTTTSSNLRLASAICSSSPLI